jgi:hypothetical protein
VDIILPDRETAIKRGWTHQVQWIENGRPCFFRCTSGHQADERADMLVRSGEKPVVIDLRDALQLH